MAEHILLAQQVGREADILVVTVGKARAIGLLLKRCPEPEARRFRVLRVASELVRTERGYETITALPAVRIPEQFGGAERQLECLHASTQMLRRYTIALSWIKPNLKIQATPTRCS